MKPYIMILTVAALTFLSSCNSASRRTPPEEPHDHGPGNMVVLSPQQRDALGLELGHFMMRNLTNVVKTNGQLEVPPAGNAAASAIIGGNVKEIKVFHGDRVRKGQALAVLQHPDYITLQEDFAEAAHTVEFLEQEYNRQKKLFANNVGSGKDFQKVSSDYHTAKARYNGLRARLQLLKLSPERVKNGEISNTIVISAPIGGYVKKVNLKVGTYVEAGNVLFEITDNSTIHADFLVYEKDVHLVKEGQKVHFTVANRPGEELLATIFAVGREFEPETRAVHIHASLHNNPGNLIPGMYVSGHIHTDETYTRTLPNDALVTEGTRSYIFVLDHFDAEAMHNDDEHDHVTGEVHDDPAEEMHTIDEQATEMNHDHTHTDDSNTIAFKMVEVVPGKQDEGYTEIKLLEPLPDSTLIAMNAAYYLLSELKKEETEHEH